MTIRRTSLRSSGDFVVISNYRPSSSGWAIILLSVTALALGGCGRKAGLDLPPTAAAPQAQATSSDSEAERAAQPGVFNSTYGSEAGPSAPKGGKKKFDYYYQDPTTGDKYVGGNTFKNNAGTLPKTDSSGHPITYKEYDTNPYVPGHNRGTERVVIGSDGNKYYTNDHYTSFTEFP